jgi:hypothetical protein
MTTTYRQRSSHLFIVIGVVMMLLGLWLLAQAVQRQVDVLGCTWERPNQQSTATTNEECKP